jgi:hypothetical protein
MADMSGKGAMGEGRRPDYRRAAGITARAIAAVAGGYALASLSAVALTVILPLSRLHAVLTGMMVSFAVYTVAVVWAFAAPSAARAWGWMGAAAVVLAFVAMLGRSHGAGQVLP